MTLAVGFFDGVHLGHRRILAGADAVLTFQNHPLSVICPSAAPPLLMTASERISLLKTAGAKVSRTVHAVRFTKKFASMPPEEFIAFLKCEFPELKKVQCGANWRFGAGGVGTPQMLKKYGIPVKVSRYVTSGDGAVSSTRIRTALAEGDVELANAMLGRRFSVSGKIVSGKGVGSRIGSPTLNLEVSPPLKLGVYAVDTPFGRGVANYGIAPTMGADSWQKPVLEVHLLDVLDGGRIPSQGMMKVEFLKFLRPERKFKTTNALRKQIAADIAAARSCVNLTAFCIR